MKQEIIYPAIYKHFKNELEPTKYIYATIGVSKPLDFNKVRYERTMLVAEHTETKRGISIFVTDKGEIFHCMQDCKETLVIYKSLYNDAMSHARPLEMFLGEVDKEKYPNVEQQFRFELVRY